MNAAERTKEYTVFESPLVEILIEWKWVNFVRAAFLRDLVFYCIHLVVVLLWNIEASGTAHVRLGTILGQREYEQPYVKLLVLWGWTTCACFIFAYHQLLRLCDVGIYAYWARGGPYPILDAFYILFQGTVNGLFWSRDIAPTIMYLIKDYALAYNYTLAQYGALDYAVYGKQLHEWHAGRALAPLESRAVSQVRLHNGGRGGAALGDGFLQLDGGGRLHGGRTLTGKGGTDGGWDELLTGLEAGWFMSMQALVVLFSFLRMLYFFRANLKFGALVHSVIRVLEVPSYCAFRLPPHPSIPSIHIFLLNSAILPSGHRASSACRRTSCRW